MRFFCNLFLLSCVYREKDLKFEDMKKTGFLRLVAVAALFGAYTTPGFAEPTEDEKVTVASVDSLAVPTDIAQFTNAYQVEAYKMKLQNEYELQKMQHEAKAKSQEQEYAHEEKMEEKYEDRRQLSSIKDFLLALIYNFLFPGVLVALYLQYLKRKHNVQDQLLDLARSGVHVQPEVLELLQPKLSMNFAGFKGKTLGSNDLSYCMNRMLWAIAFVLVGLIAAMSFNEGVFFGAGAAVGIVLLLQAVFRYVVATHTTPNVKDQENAQ